MNAGTATFRLLWKRREAQPNEIIHFTEGSADVYVCKGIKWMSSRNRGTTSRLPSGSEMRHGA